LADDKAGAIQALKTFLVTNPERRAEFQGDPGWKYRTLVNEPDFVALIGTK
jgi:hypothetical protein